MLAMGECLLEAGDVSAAFLHAFKCQEHADAYSLDGARASAVLLLAQAQVSPHRSARVH